MYRCAEREEAMKKQKDIVSPAGNGNGIHREGIYYLEDPDIKHALRIAVAEDNLKSIGDAVRQAVRMWLVARKEKKLGKGKSVG
jgi:hypothetical protein